MRSHSVQTRETCIRRILYLLCSDLDHYFSQIYLYLVIVRAIDLSTDNVFWFAAHIFWSFMWAVGWDDRQMDDATQCLYLSSHIYLIFRWWNLLFTWKVCLNLIFGRQHPFLNNVNEHHDIKCENLIWNFC